MENNTLAGFIAYFRKLTNENTHLQSFVRGSQARIVKGGRSGLKYPLLWLEMPSMQLTDKDGTDPSGKREAAIVILHNAPAGNDAEEDRLWELTEGIALQVVARMRKDRKKKLFAFDGNVLLEAVNTLTVANEIGWRFEFELTKQAGLCYDASQWQEGEGQP